MVLGRLVEMITRFLHRDDERSEAVKADVKRTKEVTARVDEVLDQFHYANGVSDVSNLRRRRGD